MKDDERECARAEDGPLEGPVARTLSEGREPRCANPGSGAVIGPGEGGWRPIVLMSFGWKRPRLTEFFNYTTMNSCLFPHRERNIP